MGLRPWWLGLLAVALFVTPRPAAAQDEITVAMAFFGDGGAYCFRLAPEGTGLVEETEWTVMMLTGVGNKKNAFRIRGMDPGSKRIDARTLEDIGIAITGIWRRDRVRDEFFDRFAADIERGVMRARVVKLTPPGLAEMKPPQRAEFYLHFADTGTRVDFSRAEDLDVEEFLAFRTYFPD